MSTLTDVLGASKPADGDVSWGAEMRNFMQTMDYLASPDDTYFVSPNYTTANLMPYGAQSDRRHFDTIQGAIDRIEADANNVNAVVMIYPGTYTEELSVTKSVHLLGVAPGVGGGSGKVQLVGNHNAPPLTIDPAAGTTIEVALTNIMLKQDMSSYGGTTVTFPMWVDMNDQGYGNYGATANILRLTNCILYSGGLANGSDVFTYGLAADGFNTVIFSGGMLQSQGGDITYPIWIHGNYSPSSKTGTLWMQGGFAVNSNDLSNPTIDMDDLTVGVVSRSSFLMGRSYSINLGGTGTNICLGMSNDTEFTEYGNLTAGLGFLA